MPRFSYRFLPGGENVPVDCDTLTVDEGAAGILWVDLDPQDGQDQSWLKVHADVELSVLTPLLANTSRPRMDIFNDQVFLLLRGVNRTGQGDADEMINLRILIDTGLVCTIHRRAMHSVTEMENRARSGKAINSNGSFLVQILQVLNGDISTEIEKLEDQLSVLEDQELTDGIGPLQGTLSDLRRTIIGFQKFLIPQASVLHALAATKLPWIKKRDGFKLKNEAERLSSLLGELEHLRERANVLQEEIRSMTSERMNMTIYRLTVVATIILPLSLFAGLMGANVGGIPFAQSMNGFWLISAICAGLAGGVFGFLKFLKWI